MICIGTANSLGQFTPHGNGAGSGIPNYSNLGLALSALIKVAGLVPDPATPDPATNDNHGTLATFDCDPATRSGTCTTYTREQLNGVVEIDEELGDREHYENPLAQFLEDAADCPQLMSQLPALLAGEQARVVDHDDWIFLYRLRPRGASNGQ